MSVRALSFILLFALIGCAPHRQMPGPELRDPEVIQSAEYGEAAITSDGTQLPLRKWGAESARFVVVGVHGFNDYGQAFSDFGVWLKPRGGLLYAYDQRGFGQTPHKSMWSSSAAMRQDLSEITHLLKQRHSDVPIYIVGLSMGGAVVLSASAEGMVPDAAGLIVVAPAVWGIEEMNLLYRSSLWLAAHTLPSQTLTGAGLEIWPSDNIEMLIKQSRDPLVLKETRIDTIYGLSQLMQEAQDGAEKVMQPLLWVYGAKDAVVPPEPTAKALARTQKAPAFIYYPDGYHMLLRDRQNEKVYEDILEWITTHSSTSPHKVPTEQTVSGAWMTGHKGNTPVKRDVPK